MRFRPYIKSSGLPNSPPHHLAPGDCIVRRTGSITISPESPGDFSLLHSTIIAFAPIQSGATATYAITSIKVWCISSPSVLLNVSFKLDEFTTITTSERNGVLSAGDTGSGTNLAKVACYVPPLVRKYVLGTPTSAILTGTAPLASTVVVRFSMLCYV